MARDRPSPYGEGAAFFHRSAGAGPRDVERFMKHPRLVGNLHESGENVKINLSRIHKIHKIEAGFTRFTRLEHLGNRTSFGNT